MRISVRVQEVDFNLSAENNALRADDDGIGAIAQFVGVMRNQNDGDTVSAMELEHYPGMTEKAITEIITEASSRWTLRAATVIHRVGKILPGEQIVWVAVCASHRHEAFQACEFIMDFLKSRAPFWKKETLADGSSRWVDARCSDAAALARW
ncbi:molybdopterin synthase catalytic subunit MoaE [Spongiibacter sp. KMU-158]|uniref:Molybdopterin synthase catalytic subunit n=1 Tax=Spongiibacter pelagi TaxID=2760804 RepID=A0A927GX99_9GAMM|nr:molybdopterin synthase catalytic subunit MoaE [Spongiibacter pelagi]MBD2859204.1 molybdopterin synthase catalytic subunit MoaE [Spongiibacter pelagi]